MCVSWVKLPPRTESERSTAQRNPISSRIGLPALGIALLAVVAGVASLTVAITPADSALGVARTDGNCVAAPPLADVSVTDPGKRVVRIDSEAELQAAATNLSPNTVLLLAPGTYNLSRSIYVQVDNVTIRGDSDRCDDVQLVGKGMENRAGRDSVPHGVWGDRKNLKVQNLTIREVYFHGIQINGGGQSPQIYNVGILDTGEQMVKVNPIGYGNGVDNGVVDYAFIKYTNAPPVTDHGGGTGYTQGVDIHAGDGWTIKNSRFENFHTPDDADHLSSPVVLVWNGASNTTVESNVFIDSDRAIAFGLDARANDHSGGVIKNNTIVMTPGLYSAWRSARSDAAIIVWNSPGSKVLNNTIATQGNIPKSIELRFNSNGTEVRNNLVDAPITDRSTNQYIDENNAVVNDALSAQIPGVGAGQVVIEVVVPTTVAASPAEPATPAEPTPTPTESTTTTTAAAVAVAEPATSSEPTPSSTSSTTATEAAPAAPTTPEPTSELPSSPDVSEPEVAGPSTGAAETADPAAGSTDSSRPSTPSVDKSGDRADNAKAKMSKRTDRHRMWIRWAIRWLMRMYWERLADQSTEEAPEETNVAAAPKTPEPAPVAPATDTATESAAEPVGSAGSTQTPTAEPTPATTAVTSPAPATKPTVAEPAPVPAPVEPAPVEPAPVPATTPTTAPKPAPAPATTPTTAAAPTTPEPTGSSGANERVSKADFRYEGSFRVPGGESLAYGGAGLGYNPANNSLFITGHNHHQLTGEISIPDLGRASDSSALPQASFLQQLEDVTDGKLPAISQPRENDYGRIGGYLVDGNDLIVSAYDYYDADNTQVRSHLLTDTSMGASSGMVSLTDSVQARWLGGAMTKIPATWQDEFGGHSYMGGLSGISIAGNSSVGPSAATFSRASLAGNDPATLVLGYPLSAAIDGDPDKKSSLWNLTSEVRGMVFPEGSSSVLYFGTHGVGDYCYGTGSACGDPQRSSKGTHAYPYQYQIWAYDAADLAKVSRGEASAESIRPYGVWKLDLPYSARYTEIGGATYDPATGRIFISQGFADGDRPVVHVYTLR